MGLNEVESGVALGKRFNRSGRKLASHTTSTMASWVRTEYAGEGIGLMIRKTRKRAPSRRVKLFI